MINTKPLVKMGTESKSKVSIEGIGLRAGLLISVSLVAYFLLMKVVGLVQNVELRALNFIILLAGLVIMFRIQRARLQMTYLAGFGLGCMVTAVSGFTFSLFIYIYFRQIDPALLLQLKDNTSMMGSNLNPVAAAASILVESLVSGLIITFAYMQFYKTHYKF